MEDEDDASSRSFSPSSSSPLPLPVPISIGLPSSTAPPNRQPSIPVTVASSPPHQILTLALPIQPPFGSGSGGRDDCWSEGATSALIDAWGERYLNLSCKNLKQQQWQEVSDVVSSRDDYSKSHKTYAQCKNRIDTLKKKYKAEKLKIGSSSWPFFHRLDLLFGPSLKPSPSAATIRKKQRTNLLFDRKASARPASTSSTSDSFPPAENGQRRVPPARRKTELAQAILSFGEMYQRVESAMLQQSMEMERRRVEFSMEIERQRMHFFMKTQMELSLPKRLRASSGSGGGRNYQNPQLHGRRPPTNGDNDDSEKFGGRIDVDL